jgi:hypothetical protein
LAPSFRLLRPTFSSVEIRIRLCRHWSDWIRKRILGSEKFIRAPLLPRVRLRRIQARSTHRGAEAEKAAPEPNPETKKKDVVWFALNEDRPLFAFAGIWTIYNGERGTKSKGEGAATAIAG